MPSPSGILVGLTAVELQAIRADALSGVVSGRFTQLNGAAKGSTRQFDMTPQMMLQEANYALGQLGYTDFSGPPQNVNQRFDGFGTMPGTTSG